MSTKTTQPASSTNQNQNKSEGGIRSSVNQVVQSESVQDLMESARKYARANPESAALWCFGIGFVLAWKLKPW